MKFIISLFLLLCCTWASAHDPWVQAARTVLAQPDFQGLPVKLKVLTRRVSESPASLRIHEDGRCTLMLQHKVNATQAEQLAALAPTAVRDVFLQAVIAHELAHCWRQQDAPERMSQVFTLLARAEREPALMPSALHARHQEETFSDVAALAWVERQYPSQYAQVLDVFVRLRSDVRYSGDSHDTRAALDRIVRHGMLYGDTPFHAADATLAALRPGKSWSTRRR